MSHFLPPKWVSSATKKVAIPSEFVLNRNPRNLEKLCIAYKPSGWWLEKPGRCYWHKLFIGRTNKNLTAHIQHYTGTIPLTVSTKEWAIKKHLYSSVDRSAHINLARVLSRRCLQSGITEMICDFKPPEGPAESNVDAFLAELIAGGISLNEPERYIHPRRSDIHRPEKPWIGVK